MHWPQTAHPEKCPGENVQGSRFFEEPNLRNRDLPHVVCVPGKLRTVGACVEQRRGGVSEPLLREQVVGLNGSSDIFLMDANWNSHKHVLWPLRNYIHTIMQSESTLFIIWNTVLNTHLSGIYPYLFHWS